MGMGIRRFLIDEISYSNYPPPSSSSSSSLSSQSLNLNDKISPSVLLIIIILAVVFFVSGLLHLLVRFLWRPQTRDADDLDNVTALQGQLQQLFHLHDSGVDQSFIDTLPVFPYNSIIGINDPFDCAVCLCEFEPEDKLRLLPRCSHAFHVDCIDTWLLSHSTCPLCRNTLLADFSSGLTFPRSPVVFVLESGESDTSREIVVPPESDDGSSEESESGSGEVVTVKLGKFRSGNDGGDAAARRCFSMGYVMEENSLLRVPIRAQIRKKAFLPLTPGHKAAMSECDGESRRELGFSGLRERDDLNREKGVSGNIMNRKESYSVSKIWLRGAKKNDNKGIGDQRRAVSFRFPLQRNVVVNNNEKSNGSTISEIMEMGKWENGEEGRVSVSEEGNQSWNSLETRAPSFARRTLLWLTGGGRQNKVLHSSSPSSNISS